MSDPTHIPVEDLIAAFASVGVDITKVHALSADQHELRVTRWSTARQEVTTHIAITREQEEDT